MVEGSILQTTKKLLGIDPESDDFDLDIITHINSAFFTLQQLKVGPDNGFSIEDKNATWTDFIGAEQINAVRSYMVFSVRLAFDPPATSFGITAIQDKMKELEWRLNLQQEGAE